MQITVSARNASSMKCPAGMYVYFQTISSDVDVDVEDRHVSHLNTLDAAFLAGSEEVKRKRHKCA